MLELILSALVAVACAASGACPVKPNRPLPQDISPDPIPAKKPPEARCEPTPPRS